MKIAALVIFCIVGYIAIGFGLGLLFQLVRNRWLSEIDIDLEDEDGSLILFLLLWPLVLLAFLLAKLYSVINKLFMIALEKINKDKEEN